MARYSTIAELTTTPQKDMSFRSPRHVRAFYNTSLLVRDVQWSIEASKTGFIYPADCCLVMQAKI